MKHDVNVGLYLPVPSCTLFNGIYEYLITEVYVCIEWRWMASRKVKAKANFVGNALWSCSLFVGSPHSCYQLYKVSS
jgi:hypothetical protein